MVRVLLLSLLLTSCYREIREEIEIIREKDPISVVDFGADGSDDQDDSEAFQKALDEGGIVHVPQGKYIIDTTLVLDQNMKLIGEGITGRYPDTSAFGSAIYITENVETLFQLNGYANEIKGFYLTGNGSGLENLFSFGYGGGNNKIQDIQIRDISGDDHFACIEFDYTTNSNIIERCYFYDGWYGIKIDAPIYFTTVKDCRFWFIDSIAIQSNNQGTTSFYVSNSTFEQSGDCNIEIKGGFNYSFENIHMEWGAPFIRLLNSANIDISDLYAWGGEETNFMEISGVNAKDEIPITISNSILYGFRGWEKEQGFPITGYDKYGYNIVLENVKVRKYQGNANQLTVYNESPQNAMEYLNGFVDVKVLFHADKDDTEFTDSTLIRTDYTWDDIQDGFICLVVKPEHFNSHFSHAFSTGYQNGVDIWFQSSKMRLVYRKNGASVKGWYESGYDPEGLTYVLVISQEEINDSMNIKIYYDNITGYTHHDGYNIITKKAPTIDFAAEPDHNIFLGDSTGKSIDGSLFMVATGASPLTDFEMYKMVYSLIDYWK